MSNSTPTTLYRLYDEGGDLLYVGISVRPFQRVKEHRGDKAWEAARDELVAAALEHECEAA